MAARPLADTGRRGPTARARADVPCSRLFVRLFARLPIRPLCALLAGAVLAGGVAAQGVAPAGSDKAAAGKRVAASHAWHDGAARRTLTLESGLHADFSGALTGKSVALRAGSGGALKDVSPSLQSPVFRDEGGRLRALPGGVVVMTRSPLDEPAARALLASHDARPTRRLGERAWLVESAAGLASLELANRLAATGAFDAAQPNWWVERALK
ncbi:MAG: hypothetical protein EHM87_16835 [Burkholderiales bacterium]|nr:MAG: hypothetical protein EHM87_16835 [Burkholderiales bacterium]